MKKRLGYVGVLLVLFCVLMFAVVGCASSGGKSNEGESCTKTADCTAGLKCVGQVCVKDETNDGGVPDSGTDSGTVTDAGYDAGTKDGGGVTDGGGCYPNCPVDDMVEVPAGKFWMGCNSAVDNECYSTEKPYHEVNLSAFKIDKYEVTAGQYKACVDAGQCMAAGTGNSCNYGESNRDLYPINCVDWSQAKAFCKWKGKRLPTEAEWEKAARGTDGRKYPWGNSPTVSCEYAVMYDSSLGGDGCGTGGTMAVGSKPKGVSPYGAEDMIGNVWEWVADWYDSSYYSSSPADNPQGPASGSYHVERGGGWRSPDTYSDGLRVSDRGYDFTPPYGYNDFGFRCAQ